MKEHPESVGAKQPPLRSPWEGKCHKQFCSHCCFITKLKPASLCNAASRELNRNSLFATALFSNDDEEAFPSAAVQRPHRHHVSPLINDVSRINAGFGEVF